MSFVRGDGCGFDILFDVPKESNTQSCTPELPCIRSLENLKSYHTQVRLNRYPAVVMQMKIKAVKDGWTETFQEIKKNARRKVDLDLYGRPDLKWYQDTCLHHFAYVFSEEVYDYTHDQVDVVRLLEAGKEFGGYDVICLWHQYPRLGVDERSQWDFFRDFPGGLAGIASIAQKCHENGVKLMLPYKPWDAPAHMTQNGTAEALAQIILDTDVDGFFLDTMSSVPEKFRLEADKVKPGCVFCTELPPENGRVLEVLNGSWQQSEPLPYQVPILRYVFPEHRSHFISRWSIGADRDNMLKKAMMNGCGLVVWQDVFGAWLPYTEEQKEAVRKWKGIWQDNRACFLSSNVVPLWPALQEDLIVNAFIEESGETAIFTVCNNSGRILEGELLRHGFTGGVCAEDLWNMQTPVRVRDGKIYAKLMPGQVAVIKGQVF